MKLYHNLFGFGIALLIFVSCDAQQASIIGVVKDISGNPIEGVNIQIENMKNSVTTDSTGKYKIEYIPGDLVIQYSRNCFFENTVNVSISVKEKYPMKDIILKPKPMPWVDAIKVGDIESLKEMLDCGLDVNSKNYEISLLSFASFKGNEEMVKMLMERGADVNLKSEVGSTALINSARSGNKTILEMLINNGADVNAQESDGRTALMYAAWGNRTEIFKMLLAAGADVSLKDKNGDTALEWAQRNRNSKIPEILKSMNYGK